MLRFFIKFFLKIILHIFWIFPINKKRIYFTSFHGHQFSCNPKYLYLYILKNNPQNYSFIWEFTDLSKALFVPDSKVINAKSFKSIFFYLTSKYIITNSEFPWYIPLRHSQVLLQTWHGGGAYKKVGIEAGWNKVLNLEQRLNSKQINYYISSSEKFTEVQSNSKCVPVSKFINTGMPRNSFLITASKEKHHLILRKLSLNASSKILLYAPTYRGNPGYKKNNISLKQEVMNFKKLKEILKLKFDGEWIVLYRGHYYSNKNHFINNNEIINVSIYDDMQELLLISDILITDFSSSMWDFSLMYKPVFLYANDFETYNNTRGFYTNPYSWPFSIANTNEQLYKNIQNFNLQSYIENVKLHHRKFNSYECTNSPKKIFDILGIPTE